MAFVLSSPAFSTGQVIPAKYTCDGENLSPPLQWSGAPPGTRSLHNLWRVTPLLGFHRLAVLVARGRDVFFAVHDFVGQVEREEVCRFALATRRHFAFGTVHENASIKYRQVHRTSPPEGDKECTVRGHRDAVSESCASLLRHKPPCGAMGRSYAQRGSP